MRINVRLDIASCNRSSKYRFSMTNRKEPKPLSVIYQLFLTKVTHAFHGKLAGAGFTVLTVTQSSND